MRNNKASYLLAGSILIFSMLACNLGKNPASPEETSPPIEAPASNSNGACANPYMPLVIGATWNYSLTGTLSDTFTHSIISIEGSEFTDQDVFNNGVTRQGKWKCDNGNLTALNPSSGGSASVSTDNGSINFQTTELSGVTLPALINIGDTWTQATTLEGVENFNGTEVPVKNQFTTTCKAIGFETVNVQAGSFDAIKIECQTLMNITITMQSSPIETALNLNSTYWYAKDIGQIKIFSTSDTFNSTVELTSYNIP